MTKEKDDLQNIDAMLQVSVAENMALYGEVRRNKDMCEALRTLMKDEIDKEVAEGKAEGKAEEHKANVEKLADNYLHTGAANTKEEAIEMAKAILG